MNPFGYHLTNLILHAANAILVYVIALRLMSLALSESSVPIGLALHLGAGFSALVFAVHPLRVESVAWATERRDVLSALFLLLTILYYLRSATTVERRAARWWLAVSIIAYSSSLLSKASGITLPIVLMVLDFYPLGRLGGGQGKWLGLAARRVWWEKVPFLLLAAIFGAVALLAQREAGALKALERYDVTSRLAQASFGLVFYVWKTLAPVKLSPLYELPVRFNPWDRPFLLSGLVVLVVSIGLFVFRHRWPAGLTIWVCYVVMLAPVLGIAQSGPQITADRYSYLSCLGWAILAGAGILYWWKLRVNGQIGQAIFVPTVALVVVVLIGLGVLTWQQAQVWHDSERLWRHALAIAEKSNFKSSVAHYNLGNIVGGRGNSGEAIEHYRQALQIDPGYANAHNNLGNALFARGEVGQAMAHFRQAVQIDPGYAKAHHNLGNALARRGEVEEAIDHFRQALRIQSEFADAHESLGRALAQQGKRDEAVQHYQEAVRILKSQRTEPAPSN
jgi:tetratricopeptide (TPR) repeat protein